MVAAKSCGVKSLIGEVRVPGDKSISHRALMLSSQAIGVTKISGLLEGEDVIATSSALKLMGVKIEKDSDSNWVVTGVGVGGLKKPNDVIDMHNAGTGARLMMGLVSSYDFDTIFTGDASLRSRPMQRVIKPLEKMGVVIESSEGGKLPLTVKGTKNIMPIEYRLDVPSAQVKSAILLAGLNCPGETSVIESVQTRDHTELMLRWFGANIDVLPLEDGAKKITIKGFPNLKAKDIDVPSDPSSAAFIIVAALITKDSDVTVRHVCMNPNRTGLFDVLRNMGADLTYSNEKIVGGEKIADVRVRSSSLKAVNVAADIAPSMIDEYPILSIAAACAVGKSRMEGLSELRVKESDRLAAIVNGLKACGVDCEEGEDWLEVSGTKSIVGGAEVKTHMDHRIAMSFLVLGMVSNKAVSIDDSEMINTSFPGFVNLMNSLGANISKD